MRQPGISDPASATAIYNDALGIGLVAQAGANKALGIHSPSTVGIEIGTNYVQAIASSIDGGQALVGQAGARLAAAAAVPLSSPALRAAASRGPSSAAAGAVLSELSAPTPRAYEAPLFSKPNTVDVLHNMQSSQASGGAGNAELLTEMRGLRSDIGGLSATLATLKPTINSSQTNHFSRESPSQADLDYANRAHAWQIRLAGR
jgi:hypothetical protein